MKDIVTLLRLNSECLAPSIMLAAADEIARLRTERDEARREVCKAESSGRIGRRCAPQEYAKLMGWDCYGGSLIHE